MWEKKKGEKGGDSCRMRGDSALKKGGECEPLNWGRGKEKNESGPFEVVPGAREERTFFDAGDVAQGGRGELFGHGGKLLHDKGKKGGECAPMSKSMEKRGEEGNRKFVQSSNYCPEGAVRYRMSDPWEKGGRGEKRYNRALGDVPFRSKRDCRS